MSMADVFRSVEEELGTDLFLDVSHGGVPISLFGFALKNDPQNRVGAIDKLVEQTTVWLSRYVLNALCKETFAHVDNPSPTNQPMFVSVAELQPILEKWYAKADALLAAPWPADLTYGRMPYTLLRWMEQMERPMDDIKRLFDEFIHDDPNRLEVFFSGFADRPEDSFKIDVEWQILRPEKIRDLAEKCPEFSNRFTKFLTQLNQILNFAPEQAF